MRFRYLVLTKAQATGMFKMIKRGLAVQPLLVEA
jgi:hypothetical protein